jgi:gamma-glutamyl:cysteine ligase YbdK (ATP-grasp superfamily)
MLRYRKGLELEAFVWSKDGSGPVNVYQYLNGEQSIPNLGKITTDTGLNQIEIILEPFWDNAQIINSLNSIIADLPRCWELEYIGHNFDSRLSVWAPKPHYEATNQALQAESGGRCPGLSRMVNWCATHVHLDFDPVTDDGLRILNCFTNWAPALGLAYANPYPSQRLMQAWFGWADPRRLPQPYHFANHRALERTMLSMPQLTIDNGTGPVVYLQQPEEINQDVESKFWWFVRPRFHFKTVEVRILDSLPPDVIADVLSVIDRMVEVALLEKQPILMSMLEWWDCINNQNLERRIWAKSFLDQLLS